MKKNTLLLFTFFTCLCCFAQESTPTADKITVSEIELTPGGAEAAFTISLQGSKIYTAYNMTLILPEGFEMNYYQGNIDVTMKKDWNFYPYTSDRDNNKFFNHNLGVNEIRNQTFNIACSSMKNEEFTATSGELLQVYVKATPYAKPGRHELKIEGIALATKNAEKVVPENVTAPIYVTDNSTADINVSSSNMFSTCILPFDSEAPTNAQVFSCKEVDEANQLVILSEETAMKAYTPYILYAENGCTTTLAGTVDPEKYVTSATNGLLTGVITLTEIKNGYILQNQGEGSKFYKAHPAAPFSLRPGYCYLSIPTDASSVNVYNFGFTPTGITAAQDNKAPKVYYDLQGRRVFYPAANHIYIVNGEKVLQQ